MTRAQRPLSGVALFVSFVTAFAPAAMADLGNIEPAAPDAPAVATDSYRLKLTNPDDYRLRISGDYLLTQRWRKPVPELETPSHIAEDPPQQVNLPFHNEVTVTARAAGVEPALIHAVIQVESNYNPSAVSPKGAIGLMQLMPDTAKRYGVKNGRDPVQNIRGGVQYLVDLQRMFDNNLKLVLAAYNAGENAVLRYGRAVPDFAETRQYVPRVLAEYERLRSFLH